MSAPWQPLLDWWFGSADAPNEVTAEKGRLWFGKRDSQDLEARYAFVLRREILAMFKHQVDERSTHGR